MVIKVINNPENSEFKFTTIDIDIKKLENETNDLFFIGLLIAACFHIVLFFYTPQKMVVKEEEKNIPVELIIQPPRNTKPLIISKKLPSSGTYQYRKKSMPGIPSEFVGKHNQSVLESLEGQNKIVSQEDYFNETGKESLQDSIVISEKLFRIPKDNISLKNNLLTDTGDYKSMVIVPPENKMAIQGYTHLAMGFGANISPNDTLNYALRNLAESVNFYTNIKAIGEDVWLYKSPHKVLTKYNQDNISQAVGSDGSFKASENIPEKYNYDPSKELSKYPLIYISYDKPFTLTEKERKNLKDYLDCGGFIILDNPLPENADGPVGKSLKNVIIEALYELKEHPYVDYAAQIGGLPAPIKYKVAPIITEASFIPILNDHELFHCFFDFNNGSPGGYWADSNSKNIIEGIYLGGRLIGLYVVGFGLSWNDRRNEEQLKMGVNMVVYALKQGKGKYDWGHVSRKEMGYVMFPGKGKMIDINKSNVKVW
jgi:hypothetical protein